MEVTTRPLVQTIELTLPLYMEEFPSTKTLLFNCFTAVTTVWQLEVPTSENR